MPDQYQPLLSKWGNLCPALNPAVLAAQIYTESNWNPRAVSPADARGIAQFIPETWAGYGIDANGDGKSGHLGSGGCHPLRRRLRLRPCQVRQERAGGT
ncbi:hypothetical protein GCM10020000_35630 [Streptomyces olivoverticillatus]